MEITDVDTLVCNARMRNGVFVKVLTDQAGLVGWGEATLQVDTHAVVGVVQDLTALTVGQDPAPLDYVRKIYYRQVFWHEYGVVRGTALVGIDLVWWDIRGKVGEVPCYKLLGGPVRDYVRLYAHLGGGRMEDFYHTSPADPARFGDLASAAVDEGST